MVKKKPLKWLQVSILPSLLLSTTFPLCLSSSFLVTEYVLLPPPPFTPISFSPLSTLCPPLLLSTVFHWAVYVSMPLSVDIWQALPMLSLLLLHFFFCVLKGLIPFSHWISTCWGNRAAFLKKGRILSSKTGFFQQEPHGNRFIDGGWICLKVHSWLHCRFKNTLMRDKGLHCRGFALKEKILWDRWEKSVWCMSIYIDLVLLQRY